jgi:DUF4097 and DUF4098 domain-containing protein YvlB
MKKAFMILAVLLTVAGLALCGGAFAAGGFDFSKLNTAKTVTNTCTVRQTFENIEIDTKETDIQFRSSPYGTVRIECAERERGRHTVSVEAGTLKIGTNDTRAWYDYIAFFSRHMSVTLYLPAGSYQSLTVCGGTGDVSLPAEFSFGSVDICVGTGNVVCEAPVSGPLVIRTSTGDITLRALRAQRISLAVSTGDVNVVSVTCESFVSEGSTGGITLTDTVASSDCSIQRSTGNVRFENFDAEQITVTTSTGSVKGTLLTSKVFFTKTSTGSVRVPETITGGKCSITTSTGDIDIRLS